MKTQCAYILLSITFPLSGNAQKYDTIRVGLNTSVNMIFDSRVKMWDMGLGVRIEDGEEIKDVLVVNPVKSPERIKLGAGIKHFETTNLFVETEKAYYNFILQYGENPGDLLMKIALEKASIIKSIETKLEVPGYLGTQDTVSNFDSLIYQCELIQGFDNNLTTIAKSSQKILFFLGGIYVSGDNLFFKVYVRNVGNIPFDIGFVGFFKGDRGKRGNKKRPKQDELLKSMYVLNENKEVIESGETIIKVYAFKMFTLSKTQNLYIQIWEGDQGERKIELIVKSKDILAAEII